MKTKTINISISSVYTTGEIQGYLRKWGVVQRTEIQDNFICFVNKHNDGEFPSIEAGRDARWSLIVNEKYGAVIATAEWKGGLFSQPVLYE